MVGKRDKSEFGMFGWFMSGWYGNVMIFKNEKWVRLSRISASLSCVLLMKDIAPIKPRGLSQIGSKLI